MVPAPKSKPPKVEIYDTTLRDGTQAEGIAFSLEDKLQIAAKLDDLAIDYIEGGYPLSNAKDEEFFQQISQTKLRNSQIVAFGMTRKKGVRPSEDLGLRALVKCPAQVVTIVAKAWDMQVKKVLNASLDENLKMISDSVKYLKKRDREVFFDAEHFFDGYQENPDYALKVLQVAAEAGASRLVLCDTNGGAMCAQVQKIVAAVAQNIDLPLAIHTHNDCGLAVANSLVAVQAGAYQVQGTINGFGERSGNADLCAVIPNLALKMGYNCLKRDSLKKLTETSRYVYEMANLNLPMNQPFVGVSSFAHKGGMHVHAVSKSSRCYEHVDPETVGNTRRVLISELSGASNLLAKNEKLALLKDRNLVRKILKHVQDRENQGYQFETAEASFDLIVRRFMGNYHSFFELDHYRTVILKSDAKESVSEATVKILINGKVEHRVAEGHGPVNALDLALRKALTPHFPIVQDMQLMDYRVRVVNSKNATAAKVRVVIESRDQTDYWGTIGVSENIIDASWQALVDSIEYKLLREEDKQR
ncbi:MAG: citramalate synthase [Sedimentisphaerales bacterium]|nr:citramalate synthase [Sedimentisphaerales bacterium]